MSGITDLHEVTAFNYPKIWTSHIHVTFKFCSLPRWVLYSVALLPWHCDEDEEPGNATAHSRQTPCGEFSLRTLADGLPSFLLSFILAVSISRSPTLTSLGILLPSLCAQGSIGVVSLLPWGVWNEIGCSTWPPLHHVYARLLLTIWAILYIWEIYAQSNSRLILQRQQNRSFFFLLVICSLYKRYVMPKFPLWKTKLILSSEGNVCLTDLCFEVLLICYILFVQASVPRQRTSPIRLKTYAQSAAQILEAKTPWPVQMERTLLMVQTHTQVTDWAHTFCALYRILRFVHPYFPSECQLMLHTSLSVVKAHKFHEKRMAKSVILSYQMFKEYKSQRYIKACNNLVHLLWDHTFKCKRVCQTFSSSDIKAVFLYY